jgi:phosphonatase-like hydrolase
MGVALVVSDMAGTTIEDAGQVPEAFESVLARHGVALTPEALAAVRGAAKRDAIRSLLESAGTPEGELESRTERVYADFKDHLARVFGAGGVRPLPGAREAIDALRGRGIKVVLNTGFDRDTVGLILRAVGWERGVADAVLCGEDVPAGRPAPYMIFRAMERTGTLSVRDVANVGDTALDLEAGHNAGVAFNVGVLSGAHDRARLARAPHTHLIGSIAELPALLP